MNLQRSIKRVASFIRISMDFERIEMTYRENPEDLDLRKAYFRECLRRNEEPVIYLDWVKKAYGIDLDLKSRYLNLEGKGLSDLKFLQDLYLPNLEMLVLHSNQIRSLDGLSGLNAPNLLSLNLDSNQINSLEGLSEFIAPKLAMLSFVKNNLTSLEGLSGFKAPSLLELYFGNNKIKSLKGLSGFKAPKLARLELNDNYIDSLYDLKNLKSPIINLNLDTNKIESLDDMPRMPKLFRLFLSNNVLESLDGLEQVKSSVLLEVRVEGNALDPTKLVKFYRKYPQFRSIVEGSTLI